MVLGSSPVAVTSPSDFAPTSSKEFLDIQATVECGFTLKRVRDMTRTYSQIEQTRQTDSKIDFGEFPSLSLESPSVVTSIQYVCYLYDDNKSGSSVTELQC